MGWASAVDDLSGVSAGTNLIFLFVILGFGLAIFMGLSSMTVPMIAVIATIALVGNAEYIADAMIASAPMPEEAAPPAVTSPIFESEAPAEPMEVQWPLIWLILAMGSAIVGFFIYWHALSVRKGAVWYEVEVGEQDQTGDWTWKTLGRFMSLKAANATMRKASGKMSRRVIAVGKDGSRKRLRFT